VIGVRAESRDYRAAVAELPLSLRHAPEGPVDIIVASASGAFADPASVIVVADPRPGDRSPVEDGARVVIDRPWLRADAAVDAGAHPDALLFTAECSSSAMDQEALVRDALGWIRVLSGEELVLDAVTRTPHALLAQLRAGDRPATLVANAHTDAGARAWLRACAIGETRAEVVIDAGDVSIEVSTEAGTRRLPTRGETRQRMTLRRAIDVIRGAATDDARSLSDDDALAAQVCGRVTDITVADFEHRNNRVP
jgi:hypothetical protein